MGQGLGHFSGISMLFDLRLKLSALIGLDRSRAQSQTSHWRADRPRLNRVTMVFPIRHDIRTCHMIFNPFNAIYDWDMDTLETLICMVYNTKGMVKIDQGTAEKIHSKGRDVG